MADAKSDSSNGPSFLGGQQDASLSNNPFAKSKFGGASLLRPSQLKPVLGTVGLGESSNSNCKEGSESKVEVEAPKFVPLGAPDPPVTSSTSVSASSAPVAAPSSFVFGQNLSERVLSVSSDRPSLLGSSTQSTSNDHASTNGNSDMLFSTNVHQSNDTSQNAEGLAAAAAEYEAKHARAPPLPTSASPPLTGEEGERNVLQLSCRLFAFETGAWRERGRGVLRLNDSAAGEGGSRLVLRAAGSLRVLINTKVWPEMVVERAGAKSLRLTATDAQARVNVFLIMAGPDDIGHLFRVLSQRVALLNRAMPCTGPLSAPTLISSSNHLPREEDLESESGSSNNGSLHEYDEITGNCIIRSEEFHNQSESAVTDKISDMPTRQESDELKDSISDSARSLKRKDESGRDDSGSPKRLCPE